MPCTYHNAWNNHLCAHQYNLQSEASQTTIIMCSCTQYVFRAPRMPSTPEGSWGSEFSESLGSWVSESLGSLGGCINNSLQCASDTSFSTHHIGRVESTIGVLDGRILSLINCTISSRKRLSNTPSLPITLAVLTTVRASEANE